MAILIQPDGSNDEVVPEDGQRFARQELQTHVGGYIEAVRLPTETRINGYTIAVMYVNEEGRWENLEHNLNASTLADRHIVGNALVLFQGEQEEEEGQWTTTCPDCGAVGQLEVYVGKFSCRGMYLTGDGFSFSDAKGVDTEDERVHCTACGSDWDLAFLAL